MGVLPAPLEALAELDGDALVAGLGVRAHDRGDQAFGGSADRLGKGFEVAFAVERAVGPSARLGAAGMARGFPGGCEPVVGQTEGVRLMGIGTVSLPLVPF